MLAALGYVAVFAGASNTPLACTIMGAELFGAGAIPYFAIACIVSYVFSSHRGIYGSQRVAITKDGEELDALVPLGDAPRVPRARFGWRRDARAR